MKTDAYSKRGEPVRFIDRRSGAVVEEAIYGERWLRFAYDTPVGRLLTHTLVARSVLSRLYGWYMSLPRSARLVEPFMETYGIDRSEFEVPDGGFVSFNAFFTRLLKDGARPLSGGRRHFLFPADGRHLWTQRLDLAATLFTKGQQWKLDDLLFNDERLSRTFARGSLLLSRLCPVDYHHFHVPLAGSVVSCRKIEGRLYSVNPVALRHGLEPFWKNKRVLIEVQTDFGWPYLILPVGATNVGSINLVSLMEGRRLERGERLGGFAFGGSAVLLIFPEGKVEAAEDLARASREGLELYAPMGEAAGLLSGVQHGKP
jgi:phosphatidylserine decarboxylase